MPRNKKTLDTSTCSDPSGGEFDSDSDDEMMGRKGRKSPPKKKPKKDLKPKPSARKPSPHKKKHREAEEEEVGRNQIDEDEDDEQRGLIEEYDEENLLNMEVPEAPQLCMAADGGDRLIITDIVVENFKSYYGTRRIGPFHHNFTSIIGPNGSGKSNVIDALLFVFGYKASKIRSKKVSVLIHSSAGKDDIPSCTVKISFQKILDDPPPKDKNVETTYQPVPNSSFSVSRTAYRNNTSSYKIDGVVKSFKEVAVRLKEVGIDLVHNRFLILQGEVEQIAMMKPKSVNGSEDGMLEYLEDIIGSSRYKVPIEKLAGKLEKLQAERSHQISKVNNANREKEALDEPVQTTISYMSVENEVAALMCKQYLIKKYNAQDVKKGLLPEQAKVTSELDKAEAKLKDVLVQLKERKEATDTLTRTLAKTQSDIRRSANELEVLVQRDTKRKNDLARVTSEMKKLHAEVKKEKEKLDEAQRAPEDAKAKIEQLNIKLKEYKEELVTATEQFDDNFPKYNKKTEADRAKKTTLEQEYSGVAAKLAEADSKCKLAEAALRTLVEEYEKKRTQLDELEKSLKTNQEKLDRDKKQREELQEKETEGLQHRSTARGELDTIGPRRDAINARLKELAPMFSDKQQEAQKRQAMNVIAKAFDEAQRHGQMKGYLGRIGDLGSIDKKYDRAISNNFSGLDLHLCDDQKAISEGSEILRRIGNRTRFLALDRQQRNWGQIKKLESEKGGPAPRLFNLIECEDKFKPAFFYLVRHAYVVETIEDAYKLSKQLAAEKRPETIVSMDGCMIQRNGTFVGGGQVKEGKIGSAKVVRRESSVRDDQEAAKKLEAATAEKEKLTEELEVVSRRCHELEAKINGLAVPLDRIKQQTEHVVRSIKSTEEMVRVQEKQRAEKEREIQRAKVDETELDKKRDEIEQLKKARDDVTEESKSSKQKIKEIDNDMAKVYNKLVKPHETARDTARDEIANIEKDLGKQQAIINGADRNIAKQTARMKDVEKDVDIKRGKTSNLVSMEETYEKNKIEKKEELDRFELRKTETEQQLKELRENTSAMDTEEIALEKQRKLLSESLTVISNKIRGIDKAIQENEKSIRELTLHNITDLLGDIPEEMRHAASARRFLLDGESDSDLDGYEEFMEGSPTKAKALKESKKSRKEHNRKDAAKKRKIDSDDDDDDEEMEVDGEREEQAEGEGGEEEDDNTESESGGRRKKKKAKKQQRERAAAGGGGVEGKEDGEDMDMEEEPGASTGDDAPMEEQEEQEEPAELTPEQREERKARKLQKKRDKKARADEMLKSGQMPEWSRRHIASLDDETLLANVDTLEKRLHSMKKQLQPHVLEDYKKKVDKLRKEGELLTAVKDKYTAHRDKLDSFKKLRLADFMGGFESISTALRELYQMITLGGDASLELKDVIDPFIEGVQFMVRPPKKSWKQIENLSGGEKTLSSLALVFALHKYRPTPLYVMDEIDAALDFRNVSIIGHYIKDRTKNAQFIIISLRNNMFELADRLIGIYKVHDCTRNVVVDPKKVLEETSHLRSGLNKVRLLMESNKIQTGAGVGQ